MARLWLPFFHLCVRFVNRRCWEGFLDICGIWLGTVRGGLAIKCMYVVIIYSCLVYKKVNWLILFLRQFNQAFRSCTLFFTRDHNKKFNIIDFSVAKFRVLSSFIVDLSLLKMTVIYQSYLCIV